jgi:hypothetical protein
MWEANVAQDELEFIRNQKNRDEIVKHQGVEERRYLLRRRRPTAKVAGRG